MPEKDIESGHAHLLPSEVQRPRAPRRGIFSLLFGFLRKKDVDQIWEDKSDDAENWSSTRGTFDPTLPYTPGKPQKKAKPVSNPPEERPTGEIEPELTKTLQDKFPTIVAKDTRQHPAFEISQDELQEKLLPVLNYLRDNSELGYNWPQHMTAVDWPDDQQLELIYVIRNLDSGKLLCIHVRVPRDEPKVPSSANLFHGFDWHEREVFELFGVQFTDHPDLRKLLLDSSYPGYPMLKGYEDDEHEFIPRPY